jgi:hypothetical protein
VRKATWPAFCSLNPTSGPGQRRGRQGCVVGRAITGLAASGRHVIRVCNRPNRTNKEERGDDGADRVLGDLSVGQAADGQPGDLGLPTGDSGGGLAGALPGCTFLAQLADKQALDVITDRIFPFDQIADAFAYLEQGHAHGKVIVQMV